MDKERPEPLASSEVLTHAGFSRGSGRDFPPAGPSGFRMCIPSFVEYAVCLSGRTVERPITPGGSFPRSADAPLTGAPWTMLVSMRSRGRLPPAPRGDACSRAWPACSSLPSRSSPASRAPRPVGRWANRVVAPGSVAPRSAPHAPMASASAPVPATVRSRPTPARRPSARMGSAGWATSRSLLPLETTIWRSIFPRGRGRWTNGLTGGDERASETNTAAL